MIESRLNPFEQKQDKNFFVRNRRWLFPLWAGVMLWATIILTPTLGPLPAIQSDWIVTGIGVVCAFGLGLGARLTDTKSAVLVSWVGPLVVLGLVVFAWFS